MPDYIISGKKTRPAGKSQNRPLVYPRIPEGTSLHCKERAFGRLKADRREYNGPENSIDRRLRRAWVQGISATG